MPITPPQGFHSCIVTTTQRAHCRRIVRAKTRATTLPPIVVATRYQMGMPLTDSYHSRIPGFLRAGPPPASCAGPHPPPGSRFRATIAKTTMPVGSSQRIVKPTPNACHKANGETSQAMDPGSITDSKSNCILRAVSGFMSHAPAAIPDRAARTTTSSYGRLKIEDTLPGSFECPKPRFS